MLIIKFSIKYMYTSNVNMLIRVKCKIWQAYNIIYKHHIYSYYINKRVYVLDHSHIKAQGILERYYEVHF